jgi:predicted dehydrogenase
MLRACEDAGVQFFYGSCYRFLPAVVKARELIRDGAIGKVQLLSERLVGGSGLESYAEMGFAHYPRGTPGGPGMGLVDHGIHLIDIVPWLTGSEIRSASGSGTLSGAGPTVEHAVLTMATGAIGHLLYYSATYYTELPTEGRFNEGKGWNLDGTLTSSGQWDAHPGSISVYGDQGALRIFQYANALFFSDRSGLQQIALEGRPPPGHFAAQLRECARCIRTGEDPTVDGRAGIRALQTLMEIYGE